MVIKKKSCVISNDLGFIPMGVRQFYKTSRGKALVCPKFPRENKIISSSPCLNYLYIVSLEVGIFLIKTLFFKERFLNNLYTKVINFINGCKIVRVDKEPELEWSRKYRENHTIYRLKESNYLQGIKLFTKSEHLHDLLNI